MKMKVVKKVISVLLIILVILIFVIGLFLLFWPSLGGKPSSEEQAEYEKRTDAFYEGIFHAPKDFQLIVDSEESGAKKEERTPKGYIPVKKITTLPEADISDLTVTWFGHSTSLLQMHGMTVFIDPVLGKYASPVSFTGAKRIAEVPMTAENLPEIDILLISHDHYDHLDYQTIRDIDEKVKNYCVPLGVEKHLERWGVDPGKIRTMAWWEDTEIDGLTISSTPGQHYSGRLPWRNNKTLWCGYFLQDEYHKVYYTGDTGYGDFFENIREQYGQPDLVLSEDGQYDPRWPSIHMNPPEVLKAAEDMGTKWVIPLHWAGFVLSRHAWDDPAEQLTALAEDSEVSIATPQIGETVSFSDISSYQEKWWREIDTEKKEAYK